MQRAVERREILLNIPCSLARAAQAVNSLGGLKLSQTNMVITQAFVSLVCNEIIVFDADAANAFDI